MVVEVQFHAFLISALDGGESLASHPDALHPGQTVPPPPGTPLDGRLGEPGRDDEQKMSLAFPCHESNPGLQTHSLVTIWNEPTERNY
jgi:hypothetical protein